MWVAWNCTRRANSLNSSININTNLSNNFPLGISTIWVSTFYFDTTALRADACMPSFVLCMSGPGTHHRLILYWLLIWNQQSATGLALQAPLDRVELCKMVDTFIGFSNRQCLKWVHSHKPAWDLWRKRTLEVKLLCINRRPSALLIELS